MRPNNTVPKTTSSRPDTRASTSAQARWNRLAALTPIAWAASRNRRLRADQAEQCLAISGAVALHLGEAERRSGFVHIAQQLAEERLMLLGRHTQAGLRHEVSEWYGAGKRVGLARRWAWISSRTKFIVTLVIDQVMDHLLHQPAVVRRILSNEHAHQGGLTHVESILPGIETRPQLLRRIAFGPREVHFLHDQGRLAIDHLHGLGQPFP